MRASARPDRPRAGRRESTHHGGVQGGAEAAVGRRRDERDVGIVGRVECRQCRVTVSRVDGARQRTDAAVGVVAVAARQLHDAVPDAVDSGGFVGRLRCVWRRAAARVAPVSVAAIDSNETRASSCAARRCCRCRRAPRRLRPTRAGPRRPAGARAHPAAPHRAAAPSAPGRPSRLRRRAPRRSPADCRRCGESVWCCRSSDPRQRWIVAASSGIAALIASEHGSVGLVRRIDSAKRAAALPVGATSVIRGGRWPVCSACSISSARIFTTVNVLPVPGPPEITRSGVAPPAAPPCAASRGRAR